MQPIIFDWDAKEFVGFLFGAMPKWAPKQLVRGCPLDSDSRLRKPLPRLASLGCSQHLFLVVLGALQGRVQHAPGVVEVLVDEGQRLVQQIVWHLDPVE